jgi:hypothetical protein
MAMARTVFVAEVLGDFEDEAGLPLFEVSSAFRIAGRLILRTARQRRRR